MSPTTHTPQGAQQPAWVDPHVHLELYREGTPEKHSWDDWGLGSCPPGAGRGKEGSAALAWPTAPAATIVRPASDPRPPATPPWGRGLILCVPWPRHLNLCFIPELCEMLQTAKGCSSHGGSFTFMSQMNLSVPSSAKQNQGEPCFFKDVFIRERDRPHV